jgi:tRNA-dihydrouridine synthase
MKKEISRKFCVAPMMGYTTPYARKLYRILSKHTFLFSEMIATKSLIYSKNIKNIIDNDFNNPVALQVGGSEVNDLRKASIIALENNYDEIN